MKVQEDTETMQNKINWKEIENDIAPKPFILQNPMLIIERPQNVNNGSPVEIFNCFLIMKYGLCWSSNQIFI